MFNVFNRAQFTAGSVNTVNPVATTGLAAQSVGQISFTSPGNAANSTNNQFNRPDQLLSSNPRTIQMSLKFTF
jgi:hypothetical protein